VQKEPDPEDIPKQSGKFWRERAGREHKVKLPKSVLVPAQSRLCERVTHSDLYAAEGVGLVRELNAADDLQGGLHRHRSLGIVGEANRRVEAAYGEKDRKEKKMSGCRNATYATERNYHENESRTEKGKKNRSERPKKNDSGLTSIKLASPGKSRKPGREQRGSRTGGDFLTRDLPSGVSKRKNSCALGK